MAIQYPDVMNDLTAAQQRFEAGCVQYLAEFQGGPVPAGGVAQLVVTVQNAVSAPASLAIRCVLPQPKGWLRRRGEALFVLQESVLRLELSEGEVGQVFVPVGVSSETPTGSHVFTVQVEAVTREGAQRARPELSESQAMGLEIGPPQGLGIVQFLSWGYEAQRRAEQSVSLSVVAGGAPTEQDLSPRYVSAWTPELWSVVARARTELNDRRLHIMGELVPARLFVDLLKESQAVYKEVGLRLDLGEAIFLAKMLTYTTTYFLRELSWQECLLAPMLAYALAEGLSTVDVRPIVTGVGYPHVVELAVAQAFVLIRRTLGRAPWQIAEQRALRDLILQCQSTGSELPVEFLYLPLILGGMVVAHEMTMEGEDVLQSLDRLAAAKNKRAEAFADPELAQINDVFEELLTRQMSV
jgi:hypothetical protein